MKIRAVHEVYHDTVALYLMDEKDGRRFVGEVTWRQIEIGEYTEPSLRIHDVDDLKELVNDLDAAGVIATSQHAQRGELAATKYHLEDMRMLAKVKPRV